MNVIFSTVLFGLSIYITSAFINVAQAQQQKQIVGATETVLVSDAKIPFVGRVDTGAETSSIHAENIEVFGIGDHKGKPISFTIKNKNGQMVQIKSTVESVVKIKTSEGAEYRYKVPLLIKWQHTNKTVLVTLNDRKKMDYALLLGRNWLAGDFIVDVEK